jgi:hypothetical protein
MATILRFNCTGSVFTGLTELASRVQRLPLAEAERHKLNIAFPPVVCRDCSEGAFCLSSAHTHALQEGSVCNRWGMAPAGWDPPCKSPYRSSKNMSSASQSLPTRSLCNNLGPGIAQLVQRRATGWMADVRFPVVTGDFSLLHSVQISSEAHPASYIMGTKG